jgi:hypothetical protein
MTAPLNARPLGHLGQLLPRPVLTTNGGSPSEETFHGNFHLGPESLTVHPGPCRMLRNAFPTADENFMPEGNLDTPDSINVINPPKSLRVGR